MSNEQKKTGKPYDETKTSPFIKIVLIVVAIAIVLVAAYSILSATGTLKRMATAYTVGDESISSMEMNIHYYDVRSNVLNQYGSTLQQLGYTVDATLDSKQCLLDQTKTWKQYFTESAKQQAEQVAVLYQEGKAAGYEMTDADKTKLDNYMKSLADAAANYDLSESAYVSAVYGAGAKVSDVRALYEKRFYAAGYYDVKSGEFEFDDSDVEAYYNENKNTYDLVNAYYYSFPYTEYTYTEGAEVKEGDPTSAEDAAQMTEAAKAVAKQNAEAALANITSADDFDAAVSALAEDEEFTTGLHEGLTLTATDARTTWLADAARAGGDKAVVENASNKSYDVMFFVSRYMDDKQAATVRHILFTTETAAETATDEEKATITAANEQKKADLEALYDEWKAGEHTEDSFAALAVEKSEDTGSSASGGLYEHFAEGTMVTAFNDWAFDPARKPGDTAIVESTYGYHLMYFVSADGDYRPYAITAALKDDAYNAWYEEASAKYETAEHSFGMNLMA